MNYNKIWTSHF